MDGLQRIASGGLTANLQELLLTKGKDPTDPPFRLASPQSVTPEVPRLVSTNNGGKGCPVERYKSTRRRPCNPKADGESNAPTQTNMKALERTSVWICRQTEGLSKPGVSRIDTGWPLGLSV